MASPELKAKQDEFHAAIDAMDAASADFQAKKAPYIAAKDVLIAAITEVDRIDNELETMQQEYEPQTPPEPA